MNKINVIYVCHGNICRSPMGEYILKKLVSDKGLSDRFIITSAGVSSEEDGNDIYPPAKAMMKKKGIPFSYHRAHRITDREFEDADYVLALDSSNYRRLVSRFGQNDKVSMLLNRDVDDPWYSGDFNTAFEDIYKGSAEFLKKVLSEN